MPRKSRKVYTSAERAELVAQCTREQDLVLEAIIKAQAEVERLKTIYYRHGDTIEKLMAERVFEEQWDKRRVVAGNGLREAI